MEERNGAVTMHGNPLTLLGTELNVGDSVPDLEVLDNDLNAVKLSSFKGKVCVISAVPSLDTPVCDMETRRFNEEAAKLGDDVAILTVSMDLPFAQKRWCGAAGVERVTTLSDHRDAAFGTAFARWRDRQRSSYAIYVRHARRGSQRGHQAGPDGPASCGREQQPLLRRRPRHRQWCDRSLRLDSDPGRRY